MQQQRALKDERSIGELLGELAGETSTLVRQEIDLARVEIGQKVTSLASNVVWIGGGAVLAFAGLLALTAALISILSKVMDLWLAALLVGLVMTAAAGVMIWSAIKAIQKTDLAPRQTVETIKEDTQWLKNQIG
ncbi:MAG: phage holin family protein [Pyrinomonadaceae bacterium]